MYCPPLNERGQKLYVPIVMQNKDSLVWYLLGFHKAQNNIFEAVSMMNEDKEPDDQLIIKMSNPNSFNIFTIDSTRFNNILPSDQNEDSLTDNELDEYIDDLTDKVSGTKEGGHEDNSMKVLNSIDYGFFTIDCPQCSMHTTFKTQMEIPDNDFDCPICGRKLIHYTGIPDYLFMYDTGAF